MQQQRAFFNSRNLGRQPCRLGLVRENQIHEGDWQVHGSVLVADDIVAFAGAEEINLLPGDKLVRGDLVVEKGNQITAFATDVGVVSSDDAHKVRGKLYITGDVVVLG